MSFGFDTDIAGLAYHIGFFTVSVVLYTLILHRSERLPRALADFFVGLMFGVIAVLMMSRPVKVMPDVFIDMRNVVVGTAALFGGPIATAVAGALAVVYRISLGGPYALNGAVGICISALMGLGLHSYLGYRKAELDYRHLWILSGLLVLPRMSMFAAAGSWPAAGELFLHSFLPLAFTTPLSTMLVGSLLLRERRRRALELALREREAQLRMLSDNATDIISLTSLDGTRIDVSASAKRIYGYDLADLVGHSVFEVVHPDDRPVLEKSFTELREGAEATECIARLRRSDGTYFWAENRRRILLDPVTGKPIGSVGVTRDISKRKALEDNLAGKTQLLNMTLENMNQGLCVFDAELKLVLCNRHFLRMFEYPATFGRAGTRLIDIIRYDIERGEHGAGDPAALTAERLELAHRTGTFTFERARPNGTVLHVERHNMPDGGLVATYTDVTEARRREVALEKSETQLRDHVNQLEIAKERLEDQGARLAELADDLSEQKTRAEEASRAKSRFVANMSHELRTPLNAIIGFSDLIESEALGPLGNSRYKSYAEDIRNSGQHLLSLINDILDFSKADADRLSLHEEIVDLEELLDGSVRMLLPRAAHDNVKLVLEPPPSALRLRADGKRLKQIVLNLLSNAIKYTPAGGKVTLCVAVEGDGTLEIAVRDTGVGIAEADQRKVLEAFVQVDNAPNRAHEGTGLGLPLTKRLVELHGGTLTLESQLGKGTIVRVVLPRERVIPSV
ncbi:MAG: PAS-domain containing protein, partial [Acidobacteriota bacterium]